MTQAEVADVIRELGGAATVPQIQERLDITQASIKSNLKRLQRWGDVTREWDKKNEPATWKLTE